MTREETNAYKAKWAREKLAKNPEWREKMRLRSEAKNKQIRGGYEAYEKISLAGKKFGKLTVIKQSGHNKRGLSLWECICECGEKAVKTRVSLQDTVMPSCGCAVFELNKTHGEASGKKKTPEYSSWALMKDRCLNDKNESWADYGGRGIKVCDRWMSYECFLEDMGRRPTIKHSIERKNTDGNYEPENCKWATSKEQANNTRRTVKIAYNGVVKSMKEWSIELNIAYSKMRYWIRERKITLQELIVLHANTG